MYTGLEAQILHDLHNIENACVYIAKLTVFNVCNKYLNSIQNQLFSKYYYEDMYTIEGSEP